MLWDHPVWAADHAAAAACRPLVITPHGSLAAPWRQRSPHNLLYRRLVLDGILRRAACIHALTETERRALLEFAPDLRVRVVPNGIRDAVLNLPRDPEPAARFWPALRHRRIALYLGRLWSGKGLDILPEAWAAAVPRDWTLVIAGPDYRGYEHELRQRIAAAGLDDKIVLTGAVAGEMKNALLSAAEIFVLPSRGEAFSMALLEAMGAGVPSLYTNECGFPELAGHDGGWQVPYGIEPLTEALRMLVRESPDGLRPAGVRARALAAARYSLTSVAGQLLNLYEEVIRA